MLSQTVIATLNTYMQMNPIGPNSQGDFYHPAAPFGVVIIAGQEPVLLQDHLELLPAAITAQTELLLSISNTPHQLIQNLGELFPV